MNLVLLMAEIPAPVDMYSLSRYLQGLYNVYTSQVVSRISSINSCTGVLGLLGYLKNGRQRFRILRAIDLHVE